MEQQPQPLTLTEGQEGTMLAELPVSAVTSYQWFRGAQVLASETNRVLRFRSATLGDNGDYFLVATNAFGSVTTDVVRVTVTAAPPNPGMVDLAFDSDCNGPIYAVTRD